MRPRRLTVSARLSRATCQGAVLGWRESSAAKASITATPLSPSEASVPAAPPKLTCSTRGRSWARRSRWRISGRAQVAHFRPKLVGSACCRWVRPAMTVSRWRRACVVSARRRAIRLCSIRPRPSRTWRTDGSVHDVLGRGAPMGPAPGLTGGPRQAAHQTRPPDSRRCGRWRRVPRDRGSPTWRRRRSPGRHRRG